jgi:hypothetical protein
MPRRSVNPNLKPLTLRLPDSQTVEGDVAFLNYDVVRRLLLGTLDDWGQHAPSDRSLAARWDHY